MANDPNVSVHVLDTGVDSNTGGQSSKSSQAASIAKFAAGGKAMAKKDLGQIVMEYGHCYVASVSMGANQMQTIKALKEAESYDGPSIVISDCPCAEQGIKGGLVKAVKASANADVKVLADMERDLVGKSVWIVGGDGWAYDIGYGGLDHVMANNLNVNVLVLDTETYSNTGGQASKSSQASAIAKFAAGGKATAKKDLGQIFMEYGTAYVASISLGANQTQAIKALREAESYNGPSIVIAYSPCAEHGIKGGLVKAPIVQKEAVECGYTVLYRFDPRKEKPLTVDSKAPDWTKFNAFLMREARYFNLPKLKGQEEADKMFAKTLSDAQIRYKKLMDKQKIQDAE